MYIQALGGTIIVVLAEGVYLSEEMSTLTDRELC